MSSLTFPEFYLSLFLQVTSSPPPLPVFHFTLSTCLFICVSTISSLLLLLFLLPYFFSLFICLHLGFPYFFVTSSSSSSCTSFSSSTCLFILFSTISSSPLLLLLLYSTFHNLLFFTILFFTISSSPLRLVPPYSIYCHIFKSPIRWAFRFPSQSNTNPVFFFVIFTFWSFLHVNSSPGFSLFHFSVLFHLLHLVTFVFVNFSPIFKNTSRFHQVVLLSANLSFPYVFFYTFPALNNHSNIFTKTQNQILLKTIYTQPHVLPYQLFYFLPPFFSLLLSYHSFTRFVSTLFFKFLIHLLYLVFFLSSLSHFFTQLRQRCQVASGISANPSFNKNFPALNFH